MTNGVRGARPSDQVVAVREARAWELRCLGWTQARIADELQVTRPAITKMLQRVTSRATDNLEAEIKQERLAQLSILQNIMGEAMEAWENSKKGEKRISKSIRKHNASPVPPGDMETPKDTGEIVISKQDLAESYGDPQYLAAAMKALSDIRRLLNMEISHARVDWRQFVPDGYSPDKMAEYFAGQIVIDATIVEDE